MWPVGYAPRPSHRFRPIPSAEDTGGGLPPVSASAFPPTSSRLLPVVREAAPSSQPVLLVPGRLSNRLIPTSSGDSTAERVPVVVGRSGVLSVRAPHEVGRLRPLGPSSTGALATVLSTGLSSVRPVSHTSSFPALAAGGPSSRSSVLVPVFSDHERTWAETAPPRATRRGRRRWATAEELAEQVSHADVQAFRLDRAAEWLADELPSRVVFELLGGEHGLAQVPEEAARRQALVDVLKLKGGADGSSLGNARRALARLRLFAFERGRSDGGLPASPVFLNLFLKWVDERALSAGRGSQGGTTVCSGVRSGLLFLERHLGVPVPVSSIVAEAAAPPGRKRRRERGSGSLPIKLYCHFEVLASSLTASPARFYARSILLGLLSSLRFVDILRAHVCAFEDPKVVMLVTAFSKDGAPLDVYLPAEGFLGELTWWPEHRDALLGKSYLLPAFSAPRGHAGDILFASGSLPRVAPREHATKSLYSLSAQAPLSMGADGWKTLGCTPHSSHGSPADMGTVISNRAPPDIAFDAEDCNEISHWRRLARADNGDGDLVLDDSIAHLGARPGAARRRGHAGAGGAPRAAAPPAVAADDLSMRVRYTAGSNREGRRRAQLRVRRRWIAAVRRGLLRFGRPWTELPGDRSDYDILVDLPPLEA